MTVTASSPRPSRRDRRVGVGAFDRPDPVVTVVDPERVARNGRGHRRARVMARSPVEQVEAAPAS